MPSLSPRARLAAWIGVGVLGGGLVAGVAVSQLGIATAASSSPTPRASAAPDRPRLPMRPFQRFRHHLRGMPGMPGPGMALGMGPGDFGFFGHVLHGEATVEAPDGTTKVVETQWGKITGLSGDEITVKSKDGFTETWTVDKNTRISLNGADGALSSLKQGDTVHVFGDKSGSTAHARGVMAGVPTMKWKYDERRTPPKPKPSPSASTTAGV